MRRVSAAGARAGLEALPSKKGGSVLFFCMARERYSGSQYRPSKDGISASERTLSPLTAERAPWQRPVSYFKTSLGRLAYFLLRGRPVRTPDFRRFIWDKAG
jgi:hypothetical protein